MKESKLDLKKLAKDGYKFSLISSITQSAIIATCILCNTNQNVTVRALWVDNERKRVIMYHLCKDCWDEFYGLGETQRESIVSKIIEKRIEALTTLPHLKMSQLLKAGFKVVV